MFKKLLLMLVIVNISSFCTHPFKDNISLFPIENYSQDLNFWFNKNSSDFNTPVLSQEEQSKYFKEMKDNTYGIDKNSNSPWSPTYINFLLKPELETEKTIFLGETKIIDSYKEFSLKKEGINFRHYSNEYLDRIKENMNTASLEKLSYHSYNRAIIVENVLLRELPIQDPFFLSRSIAGQGYPFDGARLSALYVGNAIYILTQSQDKTWALVISNSAIGWIPTKSFRHVSRTFVKKWSLAAYKNLGSISKNKIPLLDNKGNFIATAYFGSFFPIVSVSKDKAQIMVPNPYSKDQTQIIYTTLSRENISVLPLPLSRANLKNLLAQSIGRPYGWGNLNFFHDCSSDLRALYSHFGIMMPRNSVSQSKFLGTLLDYSALKPKERSEKLSAEADPLLSLIYINGHIMLYLGKYNVNNEPLLMTYQNIWGLSPKDNSRRAIIGKAVIFPLKLKYPEDTKLNSLLARPLFKIVQIKQFKGYNTKLGLSNLLY
jgi:hypothetical protein